VDFLDIDSIISMSTAIQEYWKNRDIGTILFIASAVLLYFRGHVKSEKLITHTRDIKTTEEMNALRYKMNTMLNTIEAILYDGIESFVYEQPGGKTRRISVVRKSKPVDIAAGDYLIEYHDALHKSVREKAQDVILNELIVHRVAETEPNYEQDCDSAMNLRGMICYDIHGHAGTNRQIREIENDVLPFERVLEMYRELCRVARNLRLIKEQAIEQEILEHRIPLIPKFGKIIAKNSKKR